MKEEYKPWTLTNFHGICSLNSWIPELYMLTTWSRLVNCLLSYSFPNSKVGGRIHLSRHVYSALYGIFTKLTLASVTIRVHKLVSLWPKNEVWNICSVLYFPECLWPLGSCPEIFLSIRIYFFCGMHICLAILQQFQGVQTGQLWWFYSW